ncbi:SDR family oxidoreductase [Agrobacterium vaccinii]|uniref:SDR family oxidoreductase n=1 Tax=Agrobacterium vaccinii TaxID=2735528 RepID=UPI001E38CE95|nr:SDR family oxidoreductase [Agrobacterium vaccinii]UHS58793.1 SDR family oxidoreductase [Agrobacterium vaccinii]
MAKTWFITGTSSGFGRALTEQLLARGDRVVGTVRKIAAMEELKARYGSQLSVASLDVTDTNGIRDVVRSAFEEVGHIDVVVNNAGYGLSGAAEELTDDQIRHQIDTNLIGSIQVIRAVIPFLRRQGGGRILQLASMGGQIAIPNLSVYHATKWAVEGFMESVAQEVAAFGIEVTIVEPGLARTNFMGGSMVAAQPMEIYDETPVGAFRQAVAQGMVPNNGDPIKMANAMIDSVYANPAPLRLALGSDAYSTIRGVLVSRLAALDAQKAIAVSTDVEALEPLQSVA